MKYNFLKRIEDSLIFDGDYLEVYIPKYFFDKEISHFQAEYFQTIGIFNMLVYQGEERDRSKAQLLTMKLPMTVQMEYQDFFDVTTKLDKTLEEESYRVITLKKGDMLITNLKQEQSADNTKKFIFLLHGGNIPGSVKYEDLLGLYLNSSALNGTKLNNPSVIFEYIVAELCRYKHKKEEPFRKYIGKVDEDSDKITEYDYVSINLKRLPALNSTFNAMIFEDIGQSILSSIKKSRTGEKEKESPLEEVIKY